jgi:hypothetical protein
MYACEHCGEFGGKVSMFGGRNGYWMGNHMILQTEDCIDCLREIFDRQYKFVFLYDHSRGHTKKRVGGLDATKVNKGFGGEILRNSMIEEKYGYLGAFHKLSNPRMVSIGHEQTFVYSSPDDIKNGPFYLTDEQRELTRHNNYIHLVEDKCGEKEKSKKELVDELMQTEWAQAEGKNVVSKMLVRDLRKKATLLGINTLKMVARRLVPGWEGKGKGLLQILWEQGWLNESLIRQYKLRMEDDAGVLIPEFSLAHMMESCTDFQNKMSQLEFFCKLGCNNKKVSR